MPELTGCPHTVLRCNHTTTKGKGHMATKKMTKTMAQRMNALLMQEAVFIDTPGCGVTTESWMANCRQFRDMGVALYAQVVRKAQSIDPTFDAPIGDYENPLVPSRV